MSESEAIEFLIKLRYSSNFRPKQLEQKISKLMKFKLFDEIHNQTRNFSFDQNFFEIEQKIINLVL